MGGFDLKAAFPDLNPRFHHFRLDPLDAGRVWFTSVASGTDAGSGFLGGKPTGKAFRTPPQACSLKFNAEGAPASLRARGVCIGRRPRVAPRASGAFSSRRPLFGGCS